MKLRSLSRVASKKDWEFKKNYEYSSLSTFAMVNSFE